MPFRMFKKVFTELRKKFPNDTITLGGGEPLLHPDIEKIIDFCAFKKVGIVTNGATDNVLKIHQKVYGSDIPRKEDNKIDFSREFPIHLCLSFDRFRKLLEPEVYRSFLLFGGFHQCDAVGGNWKFIPFRMGRAVNLPKEDTCDSGEDTCYLDCFFPDLFVTIDGFVKQCGCIEAPILGKFYELEKMNVSSYGCFKYKNQKDDFYNEDKE